MARYGHVLYMFYGRTEQVLRVLEDTGPVSHYHDDNDEL